MGDLRVWWERERDRLKLNNELVAERRYDFELDKEERLSVASLLIKNEWPLKCLDQWLLGRGGRCG